MHIPRSMRYWMRGKARRGTVFGAPLAAAMAMTLALGTGGAVAVGRPSMRPMRPSAAPNAPGSSFKLADSAAHGIVPRRGGRGLHGARGFSPFASELCSVSCAAPPLVYHNGAVMHKVKVYLIQWEPLKPSENGQSGTSFTALPEGYRTEIAEFIQNLSAASGTLGNAYSVDTLYGESEAGGGGAYQSEFGGVFRDEDLYPTRKTSTCPTPTVNEKFYPPAGEPCISDGESKTGEENYQLSEELFKYLQAHPSLPNGLGTMYFMLTPEGVNSCSGFEGGVAACNTNFYCAYHSAFAIASGGVSHPVVYANMPYDDVQGCETPDQPHGSAADDEISTLSHEHNEAVTDPLFEGWYDEKGEEVADKCTYPFFDPAEDSSPGSDAYGVLLGGTPKGGSASPGTAYNQEINGGHYLLQREWSNVAGGCVGRAPGVTAAFDITRESETELEFNGGPSATEAGEITEYRWEFSNAPGAETGKTVKHSFAVPGTYTVKLTVKNDSGSLDTSEQTIVLEPSGGLVTSTTTSTTARTTVTTTTTGTETQIAAPVTTTVTTSSTTTPPAKEARRSAGEIAKLLGLPAGGAKLAGLGGISLGHAHCPPSCGVHVKLVATVREGVRLKRLQIGSLSETVGENETGSISLKLTGRGRRLLRKAHRLLVTMIVSVEDTAGGSWTIERKVTLTAGGHARRRQGRR